jgi:hypothetical protein
MGKHHLSILAILMAGAVAAPALAQDAPAAAKEKAPPVTKPRPSGAVSSSYARCVPGQPIKGVIVKGGSNPTGKAATPEAGGNCPATGEAEAAEGKGRTYTGGRRNEDAPAAAVEAVAAPGGQMPSRLSMTPTTAKAVAPAPAGVTPAQPAGKSISEKGVSSTKPR